MRRCKYIGDKNFIYKKGLTYKLSMIYHQGGFIIKLSTGVGQKFYNDYSDLLKDWYVIRDNQININRK